MALAALVLEDAPGPQDLGRILGVSPAMAEELLGELEEKGYLTRNAAGRITLTEKARTTSEAAQAHIEPETGRDET